jgi:hypothetical protein
MKSGESEIHAVASLSPGITPVDMLLWPVDMLLWRVTPLWLVGRYLAPQTIWPRPAFVDPSILANMSPGDITPNVSLRPAVDGGEFCAVVPSALGDDGSSSGRDGIVTISLESPAQVGIVGVRSIVVAGIAKGTVGPPRATLCTYTQRHDQECQRLRQKRRRLPRK